MLNSLKHIFEDYILIKDLNKSERLSFFQNHTTALNSFRNFDNPDELRFYTKLSLENLASLIEKGQFNNVVSQAEIYLVALKASINPTKSNHHQELLQEILFIQSIANYNLRNYKIASQNFQELVLNDPENENYKKWLKLAKYGKNLIFIKLLSALVIIILIMALIFKNKIENSLIRILMLIVPLIALPIIFFNERKIMGNMRKEK